MNKLTRALIICSVSFVIIVLGLLDPGVTTEEDHTEDFNTWY